MSVWSAAGDVTRVQGHFCLLPLRINHLDTTLRANGPLPCNGDLSRKGAIKSLHQLAAVLGVPPLSDDHVSLLLPRSEFGEGGELRRRVQMLARDLSEVAVVRIVDKGPGQMWGFCRQWDCVIIWSFGNLIACTMTIGSKHTSFPKLKNQTSRQVCPWKRQLASGGLTEKNCIHRGTDFAIIPLKCPQIV